LAILEASGGRRLRRAADVTRFRREKLERDRREAGDALIKVNNAAATTRD